ncbi:hypothetical protein RO3G_11859 [Rhizopus delemar RA 99-880]|uniref:Uncharacterized protein n=1 Tax=Rhizopus delemar (strain RA 99-880 / ATCC MYA-4621 / FGSC 9543 / NRRL 43880) TaxID=246409 RepID=I1CFB8_RHIO9|nr:hypothetical protein RO3G_11859 [Rhizopus delemar RA 99-880]|eukprot:EIE87148.1 hypothetical protein RO3G_11859 [Rhizopus delemar RA 99-880]
MLYLLTPTFGYTNFISGNLTSGKITLVLLTTIALQVINNSDRATLNWDQVQEHYNKVDKDGKMKLNLGDTLKGAQTKIVGSCVTFSLFSEVNNRCICRKL